jgi:nitrite reductase/ring-hydroxylating ferredoxin subunit
MITTCPSTWYLIAAGSELRPGQVLAATVGATELVLFRDASGAAHALAAHCVHMGCHLKTGTVIGDRLRCPLHFRQFDGSGRCRGAPGGKTAGAPSQPTHPLIERYGALFVFVGPGPAPDFPMPHDLGDANCATRILPSVAFPLPWHGLVANGCDLDHLQSVHLRQLKAPPEVGPIPGGRFQVRYRTRILGQRPGDVLLRRLSGDEVRATITLIGGSLMVVESTIGRRRSFLMLSMRPDTSGGTSIRCMVGLPRGRTRLGDALAVRIAAWLFFSFLRRDVGVLDGQRLHRPHVQLTTGDRYLAELYDYFESLGQPTRLEAVAS